MKLNLLHNMCYILIRFPNKLTQDNFVHGHKHNIRYCFSRGFLVFRLPYHCQTNFAFLLLFSINYYFLSLFYCLNILCPEMCFW